MGYTLTHLETLVRVAVARSGGRTKLPSASIEAQAGQAGTSASTRRCDVRELALVAIMVGGGAGASLALMIDGAILTRLMLEGSVLTARRLRTETVLWSSPKMLLTMLGEDLPSEPTDAQIGFSESPPRWRDPTCWSCNSDWFLQGAKAAANSCTCRVALSIDGFPLARLPLAPHLESSAGGGGLPGRECILRSWSPPTKASCAGSALWQT